MKRLKEIYEAYHLSKYYQSIRECPMYNWISVFEERDLRHLSKTGKICKRALNIYNKLQDEVVDTFGVNEDYLKILRNKIKIELMYADVICKGDRSLLTRIEILEIQNQELESKKTKTDIYELIIAVESQMGFKLDIKTLSIYDFYKYLKTLSKATK